MRDASTGPIPSRDSNSFAVARLIATGPAARAGARFARVEPPLAYELDGELG